MTIVRSSATFRLTSLLQNNINRPDTGSNLNDEPVSA